MSEEAKATEQEELEIVQRFGKPRIEILHGQQYLMVQSRIDAFHQTNPIPTQDIVRFKSNTEPVDINDFGMSKGAAFRADIELYNDASEDAVPCADANAYAMTSDTDPNAIKKCETAAIGRAWAALGYAGGGERASVEEMDTMTEEDHKKANNRQKYSQDTSHLRPKNKSGKYDPSQLKVTDDAMFVYGEGNTYPFKEDLKAAGWQWDTTNSHWYALYEGDTSVIDPVLKHFDVAPSNLGSEQPATPAPPAESTAPKAEPETATKDDALLANTRDLAYKAYFAIESKLKDAALTKEEFWSYIRNLYSVANAEEMTLDQWVELGTDLESVKTNDTLLQNLIDQIQTWKNGESDDTEEDIPY